MKFLSLISYLVLFSFLISSCSSLKKPSSSSFEESESPYVKEDVKPKVKEEPNIVVKEEKVKLLDTESESFKYYVIIGSFKILNNAKNYKQELIKEGFTPVLMENESGLYRVSVAAYHDETASRKKIAEIRSQYKKYGDVWLLIRKY
jgi:cell division protein FtsN